MFSRTNKGLLPLDWSFSLTPLCTYASGRLLSSVHHQQAIWWCTIVVPLALNWEPELPNSSSLLPLLVLVGLMIAAYFQKFGLTQISQAYRRLGGRLTLWFTGLVTSGFMLSGALFRECSVNYNSAQTEGWQKRRPKLHLVPNTVSWVVLFIGCGSTLYSIFLSPKKSE